MSRQSDINKSRLAKDMGYNVAGFVEEIFEGAEILIPGSMFGHVSDYGSQEEKEASSARYNKEFIDGVVIKIMPVTLQGGEEEDFQNFFDDDDEFTGSVAISTQLRTCPHFVVHFILLTPEGLQVQQAFGRGWEVFFRIPTE